MAISNSEKMPLPKISKMMTINCFPWENSTIDTPSFYLATTNQSADADATVVVPAAPANADADAHTGSAVGRFTPMTVGFVDDGKGLGYSPYSITDFHVDDQVGLCGPVADGYSFRNLAILVFKLVALTS